MTLAQHAAWVVHHRHTYLSVRRAGDFHGGQQAVVVAARQGHREVPLLLVPDGHHDGLRPAERLEEHVLGGDLCPVQRELGRVDHDIIREEIRDDPKARGCLDPDPVGSHSRPGLNEDLTARQPIAQAERFPALAFENALDGRRIRTVRQYLDSPQPRRFLRLRRRKQGTALPPLRRMGIDFRPGRAHAQNHGDSAVEEDHIPLEPAGSRVFLHLHPAHLFGQRRARQLTRQSRTGVEEQHVAHFGRQPSVLPLRGYCPDRQGHDRYQVNPDSPQLVHPCMLLSPERMGRLYPISGCVPGPQPRISSCRSPGPRRREFG